MENFYTYYMKGESEAQTRRISFRLFRKQISEIGFRSKPILLPSAATQLLVLRKKPRQGEWGRNIELHWNICSYREFYFALLAQKMGFLSLSLPRATPPSSCGASSLLSQLFSGISSLFPAASWSLLWSSAGRWVWFAVTCHCCPLFLGKESWEFSQLPVHKRLSLCLPLRKARLVPALVSFVKLHCPAVAPVASSTSLWTG